MVDIARAQQEILAAKRCVSALGQQIVAETFIWSAVFFVVFGLVGGLTGGWTGAIGLMAVFLALQALAEQIAKVMARRRYAAFLRSRRPM